MNAVNDTLLAYCLARLKDGVEQFGHYAYMMDGGPNEVVDVEALTERFRVIAPEDAAEVLRRLCYAPHQCKKADPFFLSNAIVHALQDWDDLFAQPGIEAIYGMEMPPEEVAEGLASVTYGTNLGDCKRKPTERVGG